MRRCQRIDSHDTVSI